MKTLSDFQENELIDRITRRTHSHFSGGRLIQGIGDDCAVLRKNTGQVFLISTDAMVEGTHFTRDTLPAQALALKSLVANLSDIAAMGGTPEGILLSLGLPKATPVDWLDDFAKGLRQGLRRYRISLMGGNFARTARRVFVSITVMGTQSPKLVKYRSMAKGGDVIALTGPVGDSKAGLHLLEGRIRLTHPWQRRLVAAHQTPAAHLAQGMWLSKQPEVHAMMDVSDGLYVDIQNLMRASRVGARVDLDALPISRDLATAAKVWGWKARRLALEGGEDYVLLLAIDAQKFPAIQKAFNARFVHPLTPIGKIVASRLLSLCEDGKPFLKTPRPFSHYRSQS
jgi:thiamine-monophosphate kinase